MSAQLSPKYALAYFAQQGFDGSFNAGPYDVFDPEWVQGDMLVFRLMPDGVAQLALREMASNAANMSLDLTMGLAKFLRSPGITRDQLVLCEMALARSPWIHEESSAQWVRRDGAKPSRQPLGCAFRAAFDNDWSAAAEAQSSDAAAAAVGVPAVEFPEGRVEMVSVPRGMLLRLAQAAVDLQCEQKIQQVNPDLWKTMQVVVADLVREHVSPQDFAQARAAKMQSLSTKTTSPTPLSRTRPIEHLVASDADHQKSAALSMQPSSIGRTRGERFSSVRSSSVPGPTPTSRLESRASSAGHHSRPMESGELRRAERFRA